MQIIDIISENGGDVIALGTKKIASCWRYDKFSEDGSSKEHVLKNAASLAILCCTACYNLIKEAQLWALEDWGSEFETFKFHMKCAISYGSISDQIIGFPGFKLKHISYGPARLEAENLAASTSFEHGIVVSDNIFIVTKDILNQFGISATVNGDGGYLLMASLPIQSAILKNFYSKIENFIMLVQSKHDYIHSLLKTYLHDGSSLLLKQMKDEGKTLKMHGGSWVNCSFVTAIIELDIEATDAIQKFQNCIQTFVRAGCKYGLYLHRVLIQDNSKISLCAVAIEKHLQNYVEASVRMAIYAFEEINSSRFPNAVSITSGIAYEGFLCGFHRTFYRLISEAEENGIAIANIDDKFGIKSDLHTFHICKTSSIAGLFLNTGNPDIFQVTNALKFFPTVGRKKSPTIFHSENHKKISEVINSALKGISKTLLIEGPEGLNDLNSGSGKSIILKETLNELELKRFIIW
jgi:hypothetical protein